MNWPLPTFLIVLIVSFIAPHLLEAKEIMSDADIRALLQQRVEASGKTIGIVVGILDEKGARTISCGHGESDKGRAMDGDTVFEIGSITKMFTSVILADMVQRGEVKLDDPVAKYLPATVKVPTRKGRQIELVDLATHTSGLPQLPDNFTPADPKNPYADYTVEQLYAYLGSCTLSNDIGAEYHYSNLGGGLLGHALALKAGTNYEALVQQRICRPLGMTNTRITLAPEMRARLAQGHDEAGEPAANWDLPTLAGAGALRSTANDLLKFAAAALGSVKTYLQPAMELSETPRHKAGAMRIGLGWHIANQYGTELVWHNGGTGGYRTFIGLDKKAQRAVIVLANSANSVDMIGFHLLESQYPLDDKSAKPRHVAVKLDGQILDRYVGRYQFSPQVFFNVRRSGDHLEGQMTAQSYLGLYALTEKEFFNDQVAAQITFNQDASAKTTSLILHQGGMDQTAEKISGTVPGEKQRVAIAFDAKIFDNYVGEYQFAPNVLLTVQRRDLRFFVKLTGQNFLEVFPESETDFFLKTVDAQVTFQKDAGGKVTGVVLHQMGRDQLARKVK